MIAHGAAPGAVAAPGSVLSKSGNERTIAWGALPGAIFARLAAEGVTTAHDWRRLSRQRRRSIFGVTAKMVAELDALARGAP